MKPYLVVLSLVLSTTLKAAETGGELPESQDGVRFDAHRTTVGYMLVARGRPEQSFQSIEDAFVARAKALCPEAGISQALTRSEYKYLEGGNQYLMPVAGVFLSMKEYNTIRSAPLLSGSISCRATQTAQQIDSLEAPTPLAVVSTLSETFAYIDQGFGPFNRERLDTPVSGARVVDIVEEAVKDGLVQRGYRVKLGSAASANTGRIFVGPAAVPNERFDGIALLTKIGLLGIQNLSAAFCSLEVAVQPANASTRMPIGGISTRQMLPAIYSSWKQDMSNGPKEATHARVSALLSTTLAENVRAAIHAMPAKAIEMLLVQESR